MILVAIEVEELGAQVLAGRSRIGAARVVWEMRLERAVSQLGAEQVNLAERISLGGHCDTHFNIKINDDWRNQRELAIESKSVSASCMRCAVSSCSVAADARWSSRPRTGPGRTR